MLETGCKDIGEDDQRRLAVHLANCQLGASGMKTFRCTHDMTIKECTKGMSDQAWNSYTSMLTHTGASTSGAVKLPKKGRGTYADSCCSHSQHRSATTWSRISLQPRRRSS